MKLSEILAISGTAGLHMYVAQGRGGIIVESLADKKRMLVSGSAKVSALGDIAIFSENAEVPLADVLTAIYKKNKGKEESINKKSSDEEVKVFFETVLPDYDKDRVHMSDVKKIAAWYNILIGAGMTQFVEEDEQEVVVEKPAENDEAKEVKKTTKAKTASSATKKATTAKAAPKATGAKVKATKSTNIRKSQ